MSTPVWKKRLILIVGLLENLIFSGTILGWSSMNFMLKSEGVYQYICDDVNHVLEPKSVNSSYELFENISNSNNITESAKNSYKLNKMNPNNNLMDSLVLEIPNNVTNLTLLDELEAYQMEPSFPQKMKPQGCGAQDKILNLAYTIGSFCMGFTAFIWGFLLEKWGLKVVRLLISCLITGGATLLCITNSDHPLLIFPAVTLLSLGGVPLRIANMQFANLYPSKRSTIICLYSGAFCASSVVFVLLKYLFESGLSYFTVNMLLAVTSLLMFPFTLFILPSDRIQEEPEESDEISEKSVSIFERNIYRSSLSLVFSKITLQKYKSNVSPHFHRKTLGFEKQNEKTIKSNKDFMANIDLNYHNFNYNINPVFWINDQSIPNLTVNAISNPIVKTKSVPLSISLWSLAYNLHQWWFSWLITYMIMYVGSLNLWLQRVTDDFERAGNFSKIYGCAQVFGLFLAPIAGLLMDRSIKEADKEMDPFERKLKRVRAGFWPLFLTTIFLSACLFCRFFNNEVAIYVSIAFMTIFRAFLVAVGTAYLRIRFNGEHFNRLLGIMSTVASIVSLLQFPLFVWESQHPNNAFWVNIFNCFCTLMAFANPIYILITRLQTYLLHKEEKEEADAKAK